MRMDVFSVTKLLVLCSLLMVADMTPDFYPNAVMTSVAANQLIKTYSESHGQTTHQIAVEDFADFLHHVTKYSLEHIQLTMGECRPDNFTNCSWKKECPGFQEIFKWFTSDGIIKTAELIDALPVAIRTLSSENCTHGQLEGYMKTRSKPTSAQSWGYGVGMVTGVALISNVGVFMQPAMEKKFFKRLLQFLVAMGAGALATTGLLVLVPQSFHMTHPGVLEVLGKAYIWKATVAVLSVYVFFMLERLLKFYLIRRKDNRSAPKAMRKELMSKENGHCHEHCHALEELSEEERTNRTTLAWMVMAGDVIHNFVDGLAIGAAFTEDITAGISVCLSVFCEEFPHELADVAILLHSGLSMKRAILTNFLSACTCYIGLAVGILLGSNIQSARRWIFAIAGGLFLYVPLVDMLPEMSRHLDTQFQSGNRSEGWLLAALQLTGLLIGTIIIVTIVVISPYIVV